MQFTDLALNEQRFAFQVLWNARAFLGTSDQLLYVCQCVLEVKKKWAVYAEVADKVLKIIDYRLGKHSTVIGWLGATYPELVQKVATRTEGGPCPIAACYVGYRHAWIDSMLQELHELAFTKLEPMRIDTPYTTGIHEAGYPKIY